MENNYQTKPLKCIAIQHNGTFAKANEIAKLLELKEFKYYPLSYYKEMTMIIDKKFVVIYVNNWVVIDTLNREMSVFSSEEFELNFEKIPDNEFKDNTNDNAIISDIKTLPAHRPSVSNIFNKKKKEKFNVNLK